jgi:hypothetical protein
MAMEKTLESLVYALDRDLRKDRFVFRRTARAIMSMLETSSFSSKDLEAMEKLLVEKDIFTDEGTMEYQLESLFGQQETNPLLSTNHDVGTKLLEAVRNEKEARRPPPSTLQ